MSQTFTGVEKKKHFFLLNTSSKPINLSGDLVRGTAAVLPKGGSKQTKTKILTSLINDDGRGNDDIDDNNKIITVNSICNSLNYIDNLLGPPYQQI